MISPTAEGVGVFSPEQRLAFLCCQPIPDTHPQPPDALHTPNACREIRAKKAAIGGFIRGSARFEENLCATVPPGRR